MSKSLLQFIKEKRGVVSEMETGDVGIGGAVEATPIANVDSYAPGDARIPKGKARMFKRRRPKRAGIVS